MSLRFTPGSLYRTNAAKSPLLLDENVTPYWTRSLMLASAPRMTSRSRRIAPSDGGLVVLNQRSTSADFDTRRWMVLRVVLLAQGGEELAGPPGRDLLVSDTHTFGDLATAIDSAFARWDLSHLHEFRLIDGRRIGMIDPAGFEDDAAGLDERKVTVQQAGLRPGDTFEYVFDFGDSWEHRCSVLRRDVDPVKESGASPSEIVPVFGWGTIPDQYGRTTLEEAE